MSKWMGERVDWNDEYMCYMTIACFSAPFCTVRSTLSTSMVDTEETMRWNKLKWIFHIQKAGWHCWYNHIWMGLLESGCERFATVLPNDNRIRVRYGMVLHEEWMPINYLHLRLTRNIYFMQMQNLFLPNI